MDQLASAANVDSSPLGRKDHNFSFTPIQSEVAPPLHVVARKPAESATTFTPIQQEYRRDSSRHDHNRAKINPSAISQHLTAIARPSSTLSLDHLELLHHYITVTSYALTLGQYHDAWHTTVPRIALSHDWLMHGILAVSALHLAHLKPEQRSGYMKRAAMHQDHALQGHQIALASPDAENGDALFSFSLIIIYLAFASLDTSDGAIDAPLQSVIRCLQMLRGVRAIGPAVRPFVEVGPLAPLLKDHPGSSKSRPTFGDPNTEAHFSKLLIFSSTNADFNEDVNMNDIESYAAAASSLRASFLKVEVIPESETNKPPIWAWAVRLPASFVTRLSQYNVVPLLLVAHWCVLLAQAECYWWMQGWIDHTMAEIRQYVSQEHIEWLDWPSEQIGQIRRNKLKDRG